MLINVQLVAKFTTFMQPKVLSPCSQKLTTFLYPETDETNLQLGFPSRLLPSGFLIKAVYKFLFFHMCATCPAHHITLIMFGEEHKS